MVFYRELVPVVKQYRGLGLLQAAGGGQGPGLAAEGQDRSALQTGSCYLPACHCQPEAGAVGPWLA